MKFHFKNLGALDTGNIELSDLTVLCGNNNTGKTYVTYAMFGLLRTWDSFLEPEFRYSDYATLRHKGFIELDLAQKYLSKSPELIKEATKKYTARLHDVMGAQEGRFANTYIDYTASYPEDIFSKKYENDYKSSQDKKWLSFFKRENSPVLKISMLSEGEHASETPSFRPLIRNEINKLVFKNIFPDVFIVSSERTGATTFRGELNLARNRLIEFANQIKPDDTFSPMRLFKSIFGAGYPLPVKENVDFINQLSAIETKVSQISIEHPDLLKSFEDLLGGSYKISREGEVGFIPRGSRSRLRMAESSSAVRSLVLLGFYLKHVAKAGDLLMVDEPELNLHPSNQRRIARLFARLVNAGIKVFITTHSDYIIKEFNTLIMLKNDKPHSKEVQTRLNYKSSELLSHDQVRLYIADEALVKLDHKQRKTNCRTLIPANIDKNLGISVPSFDKTIEEMNAIQEELIWR